MKEVIAYSEYFGYNAIEIQNMLKQTQKKEV